MNRYCYWSIADGEFTPMLETMVSSARQAGVFKDFHVWTDRPIGGANCHEFPSMQKGGWIFKLVLLKREVAKLNYDYFLFLDADNYFVRNPGDPLRLLRGSPVHVTFESDLCRPDNRRLSWWDCPSPVLADLMRSRGVNSHSIFNCNGGFWIVHHDAIDTFFRLAHDFWHFCNERGYVLVDEPLFSYAVHMLCGNPHLHTIRENGEVWASDWTGYFRDRLPDGQPWWFVDYFTEEKFPINPAIVHAMRSKSVLGNRPPMGAKGQSPAV